MIRNQTATNENNEKWFQTWCKINLWWIWFVDNGDVEIHIGSKSTSAETKMKIRGKYGKWKPKQISNISKSIWTKQKSKSWNQNLKCRIEIEQGNPRWYGQLWTDKYVSETDVLHTYIKICFWNRRFRYICQNMFLKPTF